MSKETSNTTLRGPKNPTAYQRSSENELDGIDTMPTQDKTAITERPKRRKVYEASRDSAIPQELHDHFKKDEYDLKLIRWSLNGEEDYRYLNRREREGYEFVSLSELPEWYRKAVHVLNSRSREGLVTMGDLCLMKIDSDLRESRRKYVEKVAENEIAAVDIHTLRAKGFHTQGTSTRVSTKEPAFQD